MTRGLNSLFQVQVFALPHEVMCSLFLCSLFLCSLFLCLHLVTMVTFPKENRQYSCRRDCGGGYYHHRCDHRYDHQQPTAGCCRHCFYENGVPNENANE